MNVPWRWLGRMPYREALALQRARREAVIAGGGEVFFLLEHPRVVTVGRRDVDGLEAVVEAGIEVVRTERGGLATWHGPGQLVGYPIVDLSRRNLKVREFVWGLEQGLLDWLASVGVEASRRPGFPGVWIGRDKVAAVGTHFRKGVSMHGFALNLRVQLSDYGLFVPCGIPDGGVTSAHLHGATQVPADAAGGVAAAVLRYVDTPAHCDYEPHH